MKHKDLLINTFIFLLFALSLSLFLLSEDVNPLNISKNGDNLQSYQQRIIKTNQNIANIKEEINQLNKAEMKIKEKISEIRYLNDNFYFDLPSILVLLEQTAIKNNLNIVIGKKLSGESLEEQTQEESYKEEGVGMSEYKEGDDHQENDYEREGEHFYYEEDAYHHSFNGYSLINIPTLNEIIPEIIDINFYDNVNIHTFYVRVEGEYIDIVNYIRDIEKQNYVRVEKYEIFEQDTKIKAVLDIQFLLKRR